MERDGFVRLGRLFPVPLVERMRDAVLRRHESGELRRKGLVRDIGGRYAAVLPIEGPFLDPRFYGHPGLRALLSKLLGDDHRLSSLETVIAEPGAGDQHQHIDGPVRLGRQDLSKAAPYALTLYVALCDITEENGPTAIWAGSHRASLRPKPPGEREVARRFRETRMGGKLGDAYLFDFRVFHRGLANYSREPRPLLTAVFTRSWYRDPNQDEVNPSLVLKPRDYARIPEKHKSLFALAPAARRALWTQQ